MKAGFGWKKIGFIFCSEMHTPWMYSHASVPIAEHIHDDLFRIYFSSRDKNNVSYTSFIVIDINEPDKILDVAEHPVLIPGSVGEFDDSGAMGSWITKVNESRFFYYIGWNLGVTVPFRNSIGLATSSDGVDFIRFTAGPIVDRSSSEPHFCASCCVIKDDSLWRMWYLSCTEWRQRDSKLEHRYHIKYAESDDGVDWKRLGIVAIDYLNDDETAISRPSVLKDGNKWRMWFSYRSFSSTYRIGYAESEDGKLWQRSSESVLECSASGWDSEMVEYPFVFDHRGKRYMLYNGNGYGKTGFGLAIQEEIT